jgi:hypothetical protein
LTTVDNSRLIIRCVRDLNAGVAAGLGAVDGQRGGLLELRPGGLYSQWYITDEDEALGLTLTSLNAGADLVLSSDFQGGLPWFLWSLDEAGGAALPALPALNAAAAQAALPAPVMTG